MIPAGPRVSTEAIISGCMRVLRQFHPVIAKWFEERVGIPTPPQVMGWPVIGAGKSALILAPTGSGKTLAAFLAAIDWLARRLIEAEKKGRSCGGCRFCMCRR